MAYVILILAFLATVISITSDSLGERKYITRMVSFLIAIFAMIASMIVQYKDGQAKKELSSSLSSAKTQLDGITDANKNLQIGSDALKQQLVVANQEILSLRDGLSAAREQISKFDLEEARRFSISECRAVFNPVFYWESIGYVLKNGGDFFIDGYNAGHIHNRQRYQESIESYSGNHYSPHVFGMVMTGRTVQKYLTIDGVSYGILTRENIDRRIEEIYAEVSDLGCNMQFKNSVGLICECIQ